MKKLRLLLVSGGTGVLASLPLSEAEGSKPSSVSARFFHPLTPVILSGAGSCAKRMIRRSRRTPTLFVL